MLNQFFIPHLLNKFMLPVQPPLFYAPFAFIIGISFQKFFPIVFFCTLLISPVCLYYAYTKKRFSIFCAFGGFFLSGFLYNYQIKNHAHTYRRLQQEQKLHLKVIDKELLPETSRHKALFTAHLHHFSTHPIPWKMHIYSIKPLTVHPGDTITIENFKLPSYKKSDYTFFLCKEHIAGTLFLSGKERLTIESQPRFSFYRYIWNKKQDINTLIMNQCNKETHSLVSCMFLGNRNSIKNNIKIKENFNKLGITHHLARSGLHLVLFLFIWQLLLSLFFVPKKVKRFTLSFACFIYYVFSWPTVSFIRSLLLLALLGLSYINRIRTHAIYSLSAIFILFLCFSPAQLFFLDFQLTFFITFILLWKNYIEKQAYLTQTKNN